VAQDYNRRQAGRSLPIEQETFEHAARKSWIRLSLMFEVNQEGSGAKSRVLILFEMKVVPSKHYGRRNPLTRRDSLLSMAEISEEKRPHTTSQKTRRFLVARGKEAQYLLHGR
jgi:hypothetical protein